MTFPIVTCPDCGHPHVPVNRDDGCPAWYPYPCPICVADRLYDHAQDAYRVLTRNGYTDDHATDIVVRSLAHLPIDAGEVRAACMNA